MPNWVSNVLYVKGTESNILQFLKDGNNNKKVNLNSLSKYSLRSWFPLPKTFSNYDTTNQLWDFVTWFRREIIPNSTGYSLVISPDVYNLYKNQYNKYKRGYNQAKIYQKKKYGAVGWYNYNLLTLGCKWNCEFDVMNYTSDLLEIRFDSPWDIPYSWYQTMSNKYPNLEFIAYYIEETNEFCGWSINNQEQECINRCNEESALEIYENFMKYVNE